MYLKEGLVWVMIMSNVVNVLDIKFMLLNLVVRIDLVGYG